MKKSILSILLSILLGGTLAHGATITVGAGESIQTAVNGANSGDEIVLTYPGQYVGNVTITGKGLTIRALNSELTSVLGNFYVSGLTAGQVMNIQDFNFSGEMNCTGAGTLRMNGVQVGDSLTCSGLKKVTLHDVEIMNALSASQVTDCYIRRSTITKTATIPGNQDANGQPNRLVVLQSTIKEKLTSRAAKAWIGYSNLEESFLEGTLEIVKNEFNGRQNGGIGIDLNGTNTEANIHNNTIHWFRKDHHGNSSYQSIGIRISGNAKANILNNYIGKNYDNNTGGGVENFCGIGVYITNTAGTNIFGNSFESNFVKRDVNGNTHILAPAQNVTIAYNGMASNSANGFALVKGGAENHAMVNSTSGAALVNKGHPDVTHQDKDGTRNDIGPDGGRNYLTNGTTTNGPIPISFSAAPLAVPVGGVITIQSTGATVK